VNVAGALLDGEPQNRIRQFDDRGILGGAHEVLFGLCLLVFGVSSEL
jgi:hypothetical protein